MREVAEMEAVDRKTAAAAYRRLQQEGLVRVEPRSGVYLQEEGGTHEERDPMLRLHRQWLEHMLTSAAELGLDSDRISRLFQSVTVVRRRRIPTVDPDPAHARLLARELSARTGLECVATSPSRLPAELGPLRDPPFVVATPAGADGLRALNGRIRIVRIALDRRLFDAVREEAADSDVLVVVGSSALEAELRAALERSEPERASRVRVLHPATPEALGELVPGLRVMVWPGAPDWAGKATGREPLRPLSLVADSTVDEIRRQVAHVALRRVQ